MNDLKIILKYSDVQNATEWQNCVYMAHFKA